LQHSSCFASIAAASWRGNRGSSVKYFRRKEVRDVWPDERKMIRAYRTIWKGDPVLRRMYADLWGLAMDHAGPGPVIELGGGAGLIREYYPRVISTDFLPFEGIQLRCDAQALPFRAQSVGSFVCVAFFHHCMNPRSFFSEIARALKPGGRCVIVDPYISLMSRLVFALGTDEAMDLSEPPLPEEQRATTRPLLEANIARATNIFTRHRAEFEAAFPMLRVLEARPVNFLRHIPGGSFPQKSPFPAWTYDIADAVDRLMAPLARHTGIVMRVTLEKTEGTP